jgi:hypothetical protein
LNYFYLTGTPVTTSDLEKRISTFIPMKFAKQIRALRNHHDRGLNESCGTA